MNVRLLRVFYVVR